MKAMATGIDWSAVRADLDSEDWQTANDGDDREERLSLLGSCFSLTPSGKYYMPFACGNVDPCGTCGGSGTVGRKHKRARVARKWERALARFRETQVVGVPITSTPSYACYAYKRLNQDTTCPACEGVGSREAHLDELWNKVLESEAGELGLFITAGEGDPCDIFAGESRETEGEKE